MFQNLNSRIREKERQMANLTLKIDTQQVIKIGACEFIYKMFIYIYIRYIICDHNVFYKIF